ncbi:ABC transporter B family member 26, chloroplastic-like isoform X3 [Primulina huaijiensis]|uniref:ABC transporter B family member 26, chloroplastic-like isoform X3 n=1 Tax=Primulina huaijiensis TaxID=1492673 RepID=UPI003CC71DE4
MILSWPLALSSLIICFTLSAIFVICGSYQKKAAKLAQGCPRNTVFNQNNLGVWNRKRRVSKFLRFTQWLERLASVGMRESVAHGLWKNMSFIVSYRMTQFF